MTEQSNKVLLKVSGLKVSYGGIQAVKGADFEVREGELVTLIGSNGAGKTTTMKAITGSLAAAGGTIEYLGQNIAGKGSWDLVKQGLAMVPEGRGVFARMTITENLQMGAYIRTDKSQRTQRPTGRHHERWRAANAGHGPRADEPPQGAAAGRTLHGPVAHHGGQNF
jgi:ABC-type branched-subunit amino acid transport system ATPase component